MEKNKGGEPLFGLFSRPERGAKGLLAWLWCAGWLSGGGCGFVLVVQVGVGFGVSPFCPAPLVPRCPGGGTCTTFALHFSLLGLGKIPNQLFTWPMVGKCHSRHFHRSLLPPTLRGGGGLLPRPLSHRLFRGGFSAAPLPPPLPLSHNFCHRLRASRILAHRDKSHHFHSRGAHFPPGLKMRCAEGLISSSKG